jgi:hypothetical protein
MKYYLKCNSLLYVSASQGHHQVTVSWRKSYCTDLRLSITMPLSTRRRIWEMYARTSFILFLCTAFMLCSLRMVFLGQACVPYIDSIPYLTWIY